jgi:maltose alpha-D-glucosyltransferase/alpha-amylase
VDPPDLPASIAMLQEFVPNQGNGWHVTIEELGRYFERVGGQPAPADESIDVAHAWTFGHVPEPPRQVAEAISAYLATAEVMGRRTGELHVTLAASTEPGFAPEVLDVPQMRAAIDGMRGRAEAHLNLLQQSMPQLEPAIQSDARQLLQERDTLLHQFEDLRHSAAQPTLIRCHGDYHLGQVLVTEGDIVILDFEGEPARPLHERRAKASPLKDVAGMLRSFSYAALTAQGAVTQLRPADAPRLAPWASLWESWVTAAFLRAYLAATRGAPFLPATQDRLEAMLRAYMLEKALYELAYELNNRPAWLHIPLTGLLRLRARLPA